MREDFDCPICDESDWKNKINLANHIEKEHQYQSILNYIDLVNHLKEDYIPKEGIEREVQRLVKYGRSHKLSDEITARIEWMKRLLRK